MMKNQYFVEERGRMRVRRRECEGWEGFYREKNVEKIGWMMKKEVEWMMEKEVDWWKKMLNDEKEVEWWKKKLNPRTTVAAVNCCRFAEW